MNIREPQDYRRDRSGRPARRSSRLVRRVRRLMVLLVLLLLPLGYWRYQQALPLVSAAVTTPVFTPSNVELDWPAQGMAALGVPGQSVLAATSNQKPTPTASTAKVMAATAVLKQYPLQLNQQGPTITMTSADVALYNEYVAKGGSVLRVVPGQELTEYQALQAMLVPSANNIADRLAIWAYGSLDNYHVAANQIAASLGMTQSHFGVDASGYDPQTVSTAHDLVLLGQAALQNPVLKEIMGQKSSVFPVAGSLSNYNAILGRSGIFGIKTGHTDEAGGCYLFAAEQMIDGHKATVVGAIMDAPSLTHAFAGAINLVDSAYGGFGNITVVRKGQLVARYNLPWGGRADLVAGADLEVFGWRGGTVRAQVSADPWSSAKGQPSGSISAPSANGMVSQPLVLASKASPPSGRWRLLR